MSPKLKPLLLPQLVEERKKTEIHHIETDGDRQYVYYTRNSSSSDIASPVTPTFSTRGHQRCSSSASSLDLPVPSLTDSPASPATTSTPGSAPPSHKAGKRQLPDVQEEAERDDEDVTLRPSDQSELYGCLCDDYCIHRDNSHIMTEYDEIDYDAGFASDSDYSAQGWSRKPRSEFGSRTSRFGQRFPSLSRWRMSKPASQANLTSSPTTETNFENALPAMSMSRTVSSRSSSMSSPSHQAADRSFEPAMPATPPRSFWESKESIDTPATIEIEIDQREMERDSIERERALATTPLLPPALNEALAAAPHKSPLQSPSVLPSPTVTELPSPQTMSHAPTPALSAKPSISSFRGFQLEQQAPIPGFLQEHDKWSDSLGHANFTIHPQPYQPEDATLESLQTLLKDWEAARANYTKHIVRTGENYGQTSKIYSLTEAKWAEIDREWREIHERTMKRVPDLSSKTDDALPAFVSVRQTASASNSRSRSRGRGRARADSTNVGLNALPASATTSMIPRLADAEGKFPARGDEDIVGPMVREATMARAVSEDRKGRFWRSLADKVGLKR